MVQVVHIPFTNILAKKPRKNTNSYAAAMDQHPLLLANESIHDSGIIEDVHQESECDTGNEEYGDESNLESNLRRRKGKIISCVENGELFYCGESGFYLWRCSLPICWRSFDCICVLVQLNENLNFHY